MLSSQEGFGSIKTKHPQPLPTPLKVQRRMSLHLAPTDALQNARGLLELVCVTGVIFPCIGLRMDVGGSPPFSATHKSPLSLGFIVGKAVKIFLPHLQDFLVPAVPNSWEKPGVFSLPLVTPRLGRWDPGLLPLLAAGRLARAESERTHRRLVQVSCGEHPCLPSAGGGAVAVINRRKWEMSLQEKIIIPRLCQNLTESSRKKGKQDLGNLV